MILIDFKQDKIDIFLQRLVMIGAAILLVTQVLLLSDTARPYLSRVDRLEGEPFRTDAALYAAGTFDTADSKVVSKSGSGMRDNRTLLIRMVRPTSDARAFVTVNGARLADFARGEAQVSLYEGDYVEIDARQIPEDTRFVLTIKGGSIVTPIDGMVLEGHESIVTVGRIRFK